MAFPTGAVVAELLVVVELLVAGIPTAARSAWETDQVTTPSGVSPLACWNAITLCLVVGPKCADDRRRKARARQEVLEHADVVAAHPLAQDPVAHVLGVAGILVAHIADLHGLARA